MFLLPRPTLEATLACDGAWSRWLVGTRMWACAIRMTSPAGIGMETKPRRPATWLVRKKHSTEFSIPQETVDRIDETISLRSSLIISDEPLSSEAGQGTEFVVLLSGEPQGGIKNRRRGPEVEVRYRRPGGSVRILPGAPGCLWRSIHACEQLSHTTHKVLLSILFVRVRGSAVCRHVQVHAFSVMHRRNMSRCCTISRLSTG